MLRKKAEPIESLLVKFLRDNGLETPLNEMHAVDAWHRLVPDGVARYTKQVEVRNSVLFVTLTNPSLRANMMMTRGSLVQRINADVGAQVITNIVFR